MQRTRRRERFWLGGGSAVPDGRQQGPGFGRAPNNDRTGSGRRRSAERPWSPRAGELRYRRHLRSGFPPRASFDVVVSNEAIEHVRDLDKMFRVCADALRPGGRLVLGDSNNVLTPGKVREAAAMWRARDSSWPFVEKLKAERPIENADAEPYAATRRRLIAGAAPAISERALTALTAATAGLVEGDVMAAVGTFERTGELPVPPVHSWCRNPVTGEYCERLLDPFEVARAVAGAGLEPRVHHAVRRWPLSWGNSVKTRWASSALFRWRSVFIIVARKPS